MSRATTTMLVWLLAAALVGGCSRSKEDLVEKSRNASTRAELEQALGRPSDIAKLGPVEQWTYKPSNSPSTQRMPGTRSSAATKCISDVPGLVKHTSTPLLSSECTRLSAPFIV